MTLPQTLQAARDFISCHTCGCIESCGDGRLNKGECHRHNAKLIVAMIDGELVKGGDANAREYAFDEGKTGTHNTRAGVTTGPSAPAADEVEALLERMFNLLDEALLNGANAHWCNEAKRARNDKLALDSHRAARKESPKMKLRAEYILEECSKHTNWSLRHRHPDFCDDADQTERWEVLREYGGINDREVDVIGTGATVEDAILAAISWEENRKKPPIPPGLAEEFERRRTRWKSPPDSPQDWFERREKFFEFCDSNADAILHALRAAERGKFNADR